MNQQTGRKIHSLLDKRNQQGCSKAVVTMSQVSQSDQNITDYSLYSL